MSLWDISRRDHSGYQYYCCETTAGACRSCAEEALLPIDPPLNSALCCNNLPGCFMMLSPTFGSSQKNEEKTSLSIVIASVYKLHLQSFSFKYLVVKLYFSSAYLRVIFLNTTFNTLYFCQGTFHQSGFTLKNMILIKLPTKLFL